MGDEEAPSVGIDNDDIYNFTQMMHKVCGNGDVWQYNPTTYVYHVVWHNQGPIISLLDKHNFKLPQEDIFFTYCMF